MDARYSIFEDYWSGRRKAKLAPSDAILVVAATVILQELLKCATRDAYGVGKEKLKRLFAAYKKTRHSLGEANVSPGALGEVLRSRRKCGLFIDATIAYGRRMKRIARTKSIPRRRKLSE